MPQLSSAMTILILQQPWQSLPIPFKYCRKNLNSRRHTELSAHLQKRKNNNFFVFLFGTFTNFVYFCSVTRVARRAWGSISLLEKDVYERYLLRADLANQSSEDTQLERPLRVYCTLTFHFVRFNISRRGLSRVVYPEQGHARARTWDKRESRAPTSFRLPCWTAESGEL